jgi:hypothetical protein
VSASLDPAATAFTDAAHALERALAQTRPAWDDSARHDFDRRHTDTLPADARHTQRELAQLAQELKGAIRLLASSTSAAPEGIRVASAAQPTAPSAAGTSQSRDSAQIPA